jgi:hypothetical protein
VQLCAGSVVGSETRYQRSVYVGIGFGHVQALDETGITFQLVTARHHLVFIATFSSYGDAATSSCGCLRGHVGRRSIYMTDSPEGMFYRRNVIGRCHPFATVTWGRRERN